MAPVRLAEILIQGMGTTEELYEGATLLKSQTHPLSQALLIAAYNRLKLWHEAYGLANTWAHSPGEDPLMQEAAFLAAIHGSMAACALKDSAFASRLLGRAESLHGVLELKGRDIMLRTEVERINNIEGRSNPDAIRAILREELNYHQRQHNVYNLAESLAARGQYRDARRELAFAASDDVRAAGMRAFYSAMLGEQFEADDSRDDYMRLARAAAGARGGQFEAESLDFEHEPQATYGRVLAMENLHRSFPTAARRILPTLPIPKPHDQQIWWIINRLGALTRGIPVQDAHRVYDVWHYALSGIRNVREILSPTRAGAYADRTLLLASIPGTPDHMLQLRRDMPLLIGEHIVYKGEEIRAAGRIGEVLIAQAINPNMPNIDPLRGDEPKRWETRVKKLIKANIIPHAPVNPGYSIRAALHIRKAIQMMCFDTTEADIVVNRLMSELSEDCRRMVYAGVGGDVFETQNDNAADARFDSSAPCRAC